MEPAVQVQYVCKNEEKGDVSSDPLQRVSFVARIRIVSSVRMPTHRDPHADDRMEKDRQEDKHPLDDRKKRNRMDGENCVLEDIRTTAQASIRKQVDAHVRPDRD